METKHSVVQLYIAASENRQYNFKVQPKTSHLIPASPHTSPKSQVLATEKYASNGSNVYKYSLYCNPRVENKAEKKT